MKKRFILTHPNLWPTVSTILRRIENKIKQEHVPPAKTRFSATVSRHAPDITGLLPQPINPI